MSSGLDMQWSCACNRRTKFYENADLVISLDGTGKDTELGAPVAVVMYRTLCALKEKIQKTKEVGAGLRGRHRARCRNMVFASREVGTKAERATRCRPLGLARLKAHITLCGAMCNPFSQLHSNISTFCRIVRLSATSQLRTAAQLEACGPCRAPTRNKSTW